MSRRARSGLVQPTQPFSLWRGTNDELRSERDLRFYGIRDEALCFDAFHDFAGTFEFGFVFEAYARANHDFRDAVLAFDIFEQAFGLTFISHRSQTFRLGEREKGQHHACVDRAHEQLFRCPDVWLAFELRWTANIDVWLS